MSSQEYQLPSNYFEIRADGLPFTRTAVDLHINSKEPEIVTLKVGGIEITTVRENWSHIYVLLSRIVSVDGLVRSFQAVTPGEWTEVSA